ncbi:MAG: PorT family protein [Flaviaesturariibacter sp.]|nr:PorT family protein [Flaviaesturariibacter sp.]
MRKGILIAGLLAISAGIVNAQKSYSAGIKAGANIFNLKEDKKGGFDYQTRTSANAGFFFHIPIMGGFGLQPELLYSGEGAKFKDTVAKTSNTIRLQYVNIPVMIQYNTPFGLTVEAGPQLGILVQGKQVIDKSGSKSELDLLSKNLKVTQLAVAGGLSYHFMRYGIYGRYVHGLSNLSKVETDPKLTSSGFQVGLSVWFKQ